MNLEKRARELLAAQFDANGACAKTAMAARDTYTMGVVRAIIAALTPPEGYVLVPVETLEEVAGYADAFVGAHEFVRMTKQRKMLHVRKAQEIIDAYHQEFANVND